MKFESAATAVVGADLSIGGAGPSDEACIVSKGSGINTHFHIIELGVEQHKWVRSVKTARGQHQKQHRMMMSVLTDTIQ